MKTIWVNGNRIAQKCISQLKAEISQEVEQHGQFYRANRQLSRPELHIVNVGSDAASLSYISKKIKSAGELGVGFKLHQFMEEGGEGDETLGKVMRHAGPQNVHLRQISLPDPIFSQQNISSLIGQLNTKPQVSGILLQLPLQPSLQPSTDLLLSQIHPNKDVDCLTPSNRLTLLNQTSPQLLPCTPAAVLAILDEYGIDIKGKRVVVVGRSQLVGLPLFHLLLSRNATITLCHIHTTQLNSITKQADVVVSAVGKPGLITELKKGSIAIDVGISRSQGNKLLGDIPQKVKDEQCSLATPVPGGVGPLTVAMLMRNTVSLWRGQMRALREQIDSSHKR